MSANPYTAIVSLANWRLEGGAEHQLNCKFITGSATHTTIFPFQDVLCLEIGQKTTSIQVIFTSEGLEVANGNLEIPKEVSETVEIETTCTLQTALSGSKLEGLELEAEFHLTFINSNLYQSTQEKKTKTGSLKNSKKIASKKISSQKRPSPVKSRTSTSKNPSRERGSTYNETELNGYLNRVVDHHFEDAKKRVNQDLSGVSDCLYLNKFNKMANSELINAGALSPSLPTRGGRLGETSEYKESLDQTASPEKLRARYANRGGSKSPAKAGGIPDMTSLLMDTETRRYVNEYKNQLEYLRTIIYGLDLKVRENDTWKREVENLRESNEKGNNAREELRKTLLETTQDLKDESAKLNQVILDMENHNKDILKDLKIANNRVEDVEGINHGLEIRIAQLESENTELRTKAKTGEVYKKQVEQTRNDYITAQNKHNEILQSLGEKMKRLDDALSSTTDRNKVLLEENSRLQNAVSELKVQLTQEKNNNLNLQQELSSLSQQLTLTEGSVELFKSMQEQKESVHRDLQKMSELNFNFVSQIENLESEILEKTRDAELLQRKNQDDLLKAQHRIKEQDETINELKNKHNLQRKDNIELKNHIITLEQLLCVKEDVYGQLQTANQRLIDRENDCDSLRATLNGNSKVIESLGDKTFETEKCIIYLRNMVADKEDYINNLKKLLLEMKNQSAVYIPVGDDLVDKRMAEWINASNDPHKLTTLFIREREGVYQFGTKRIYVKIENEKIFIRVGGGFLALDEFLRIHVPIELEKMAAKDPVSVLTTNIAVNKMVAGRACNDREKSRTKEISSHKGAVGGAFK